MADSGDDDWIYNQHSIASTGNAVRATSITPLPATSRSKQILQHTGGRGQPTTEPDQIMRVTDGSVTEYGLIPVRSSRAGLLR